MARVYDFVDEGGECNTNLDCRTERNGGHPTTQKRFQYSANGDLGRFRDCFVGRSGYTAFCMECTNECDCNPGQYCHTDPGECTPTGGTAFLCDAESEKRWGTCQQKDGSGSILGRVCTGVAAASSYYSNTEDGNFALGYCGKNLYYNASFFDYNTPRANSTRVTLWSGYCYNRVCQECSSAVAEGSTLCNGHRICVDGQYIRTSGTSPQGKVQQAGTDAVQSEVYRNSQIGASFLAFIVIITIVLCVAMALGRNAAKR